MPKKSLKSKPLSQTETPAATKAVPEIRDFVPGEPVSFPDIPAEGVGAPEGDYRSESFDIFDDDLVPMHSQEPIRDIEQIPKSPLDVQDRYQVYCVRQVVQPNRSHPLSVLVIDSAFYFKEDADARAISIANAKPGTYAIVVRLVNIICLKETVTLKLERICPKTN